jgi:hypothetical protein
MWKRAERYPLKPNLALIENPQNLPAGVRLLSQIQDPQAPGEDYLFFANHDGLSILRAHGHTSDSDSRYAYEQSDFPKHFVQWFAPALRDFRKPSAQHASSCLSSPVQDVGGEMLTLERGMAVGSDGSPGYIVNNWSRKRFLQGIEDHFMPMNVAWTEAFIFKGGLIRLLGEIRL